MSDRNDDLRQQQRHLLIEAFNQMSEAQDRLVLALSGGALVLSIALISDIASEPEWIWVLVSAWVCFGASLAALLLSYPVAKKKATRAIDGVTAELQGRELSPNREGWDWTSVLNYAALVLLLIGLILLILFATINVT